ncbi:MATE family efflux transporter [Gymnodinialimonas ceratoperidinii]|uniref:MATE family efflux transporter n=1 Tax=Gymnodinialimonas ceratoperidinii TaxID=2856823 RepID=A0A8F6YBK6_9RHOB|nr:MATE family efflux transporter [Gymnodinialimonas ceratoperidinii]QXT41064.1 MATE family efflux transporter [Gymnodinialimonas ceratoperidinii]
MDTPADVASTPPQPLTHRRVLKIAVPIVVSNATVPLLGIVDVGVVGQMGDAAPIGAVGIGAIILSSVFWIFGFLRMGTVGLVGQAEGAGDMAEVSAILTRALIVAGVGGLLLIAAYPLIVFAAFSWESTTADVEALARRYLFIRIWTAPFAISVYALTGWLVAQERTGAVFAVQLIMNSINIGLNFLFVLGFGWGVEGVALSTAIAEIIGAGIGLWFCRNAFARPAWRDWPRVFERARLVRMMLLNADILIRSALLVAMFTSFTFLGAQFGEVTLAANEVLIQFLYLTAYAMDGFAFAAETLIARAFGRRDPARLRRSAVMTSMWGAGICVAMGLGFWLGGPWLIDLLAKDAEVQQTARVFLPYMVFAPAIGCAAWMLDGIFIGAARGRDMRNMMILSAGLYVVAAVVLIPWLGNHGVWAALLVSFAARGASLGTRYPALERAAA